MKKETDLEVVWTFYITIGSILLMLIILAMIVLWEFSWVILIPIIVVLIGILLYFIDKKEIKNEPKNTA